MSSKVTVAGSAAVWDYIFPVSKLPGVGDIVKINHFCKTPFPGGCAPNIAVGIARLCGCQPKLYYPVGNDFDESGLEKAWARDGIDCSCLTRVAKESSGCSWMYMQPDGSTMCFAFAGAADLAVPSTVGNLGEWVVVAPVFNQFTKCILEEALAEHKKLILTGICADDIIPYLPFVHSLIINAHEAEILAKAQSFSSIKGLADSLGDTVLYVTQGKKGSMVFDRGEVYRIPIIPDEKAQDFTGAGDAYTSGVVSGLIMGLKSADAAYIGSTNSSFVVEEYGGQTNLPVWKQLKERLSVHAPGLINNLEQKRSLE